MLNYKTRVWFFVFAALFVVVPIGIGILRGESAADAGTGGYPARPERKKVDPIAVNGEIIGHDNLQSYRNLFANVFSDFHLFDYLHGLKEVDDDRARELLELTDLLHNTAIVDRRVQTVRLSSGQRKRLALVVSLLEDKPILLLDEWAAEQDRPFRRKFYREILPWLKHEQKRTVVAVTHDDDYYDVADRVLKMEFGRIVPTFRH